MSRKAKELRDTADRLESSINYSASPSSEEWTSPEHQAYVRQRAAELRREADRLEADSAQPH